ncbi:hypothetical protein [Thioflexithrix psekupsensis]|uniref:Homoserine kinase n=1 Tax=Thioflexithrix psekupsensis TaxID=1570016 RepID=A0A251X7U7_9GAMM|nr:hypothetical protein [Thioflexithrix psekupsensis]OUD14051.1 hypothetical protein TPSD3_06850 [Thioflexithrix psekupsensis]
MTPLTYDTITLLAPAQVANFGGLFDRAGKLCRRPPLGPHDAEGGPGNWMHITRLPDRKGHIELDIYLRRCDEQGYWQAPEPFTALLDHLRQHPEHDIIRLLTAATASQLSSVLGRKIDDGYRIQLIIHTPNGQTGLGLGGSASSAAIVVGIDALYGSPIAQLPRGELHLLRLAAEGERIASGRLFYDNVAPLIIKGDLIYLTPTPSNATEWPQVQSFECPSQLHLVTITPDFAVSTAEMTQRLQGQHVAWQVAERAGDYKMEFMRGLLLKDIHLMIRNATNLVTEPIRATAIRGYTTAQAVVSELNEAYDPEQPRFSLGISGSGPTLYALACSWEEANQVGYEIFKALQEKDGVYSWWFCHRTNPHGAEIIGREISGYGI